MKSIGTRIHRLGMPKVGLDVRVLLLSTQGCILLNLSVISSKFIQKFAQKCQYFTLIDQSLPPDNCYIPCLLREEAALNFQLERIVLFFVNYLTTICKVCVYSPRPGWQIDFRYTNECASVMIRR